LLLVAFLLVNAPNCHLSLVLSCQLQRNVTKLLCISHVQEGKKALWPGIIQQPVNAGSRRIGAKTAMPGVDYRPH